MIVHERHHLGDEALLSADGRAQRFIGWPSRFSHRST
jgi:hypothetical protein